MARYIDSEAFRQKLINRQITTQFFNDRERHEIGCIIDMLDNAPAADVAEVVHCEDCVKDGRFDCPLCYIENHTLQFINHDAEFFCKYGERKEADK